MKILIRTNENKKWLPIDSINTKAEMELQKLLVESPSLIPVKEIREGISPLVFAVSEFGLPGSGNTDVLAFNSDGDIAIVECKLATNPESKRKVVGQILEYAAYLWQMGYEELNSRIKRLKGKNLAELIEELVEEEWDEERFRNGVESCLKTGSFSLIIVVDEINEELKRIVRYLNECSKSAFSFHALEMNRFQSANIEVLVPNFYGVSTKPPLPGIWDEEKFFKVLEESVPDSIGVVRDLYKWTKTIADRVSFGRGIETGSFTLHFLRDSKIFSIFSVFTNGRLTLNYGWFSKKIDQGTMKEFHARLKEIPGFRHIPSDFSKWASLKVLDAFKKPEDIDIFKKIVDWLKDNLGSTG